MKRFFLFFCLFICAKPIRDCETYPSSKFLRIIGGQSLESRWFPWQAVLITYNEDGKAMLCGGTVIDDFWILTAAHCVSQTLHSMYILTGVNSLSDPQHITSAKSAYIHPEYDPASITHDIALIKSSKKIVNSEVKPICLAKRDDELTTPGKPSFATGFGLRFDNATKLTLTISDVIMATQIPIISRSSCFSSWNSATAGLIKITENEVCAGSLFHGTSPGDSGGPLFIVDDLGREVQVGITSFGAAGLRGIVDQNTFPGVYTRVSKYIEWIEIITSSSGTSWLGAVMIVYFFF